MTHTQQRVARGFPARPALGYGRVEPVHDALVAARLAGLRPGARHPQPGPTDQPARAPSPRRGVLRTVRLRVGRGLATLGHVIEGRPECPDTQAAGVA